MSSDSIIDVSVISSVPIVEEGSESPGMSELVDRMLEYQPPSHLTAEMGEAVDEVIKYMKTTAELLSIFRKWKNGYLQNFAHILNIPRNCEKI